MLISLLFENPVYFGLVALILIMSLSIHEFAHALTASLLGDLTAKNLGRVTLDPRKHLDPLGSLFMLFLGFGWGKPVPYDPLQLSNPRRDSALISLAGPLSNLFLGVLLAVLASIIGGIWSVVLLTASYINLNLAFFNLLPIHPLDGYSVVLGVLPDFLAVQWLQIQSFGSYVLIILVMTGLVGNLVFPLVTFVLSLISRSML